MPTHAVHPLQTLETNGSRKIRSSYSFATLLFMFVFLSMFSLFITGSSESSVIHHVEISALEPTPPDGGNGCVGAQCNTSRPKNPDVTVRSCVRPVLSVALLIDRSTSVHDYGQTAIDQMKAAAKYVVESFYSRFDSAAPDFDLKFVVYAFATRTVVQNDEVNGSIVTDANTIDERNGILQVIDMIHFGDGTSGDLSASSSPTDLSRGYNGGAADAIQQIDGEYGHTNWQDAFMTLMQNRGISRASGDRRYGPFIGRIAPLQNGQVDLAIMLTDGLPNRTDGLDGRWSGTRPGLEIDWNGEDRPGIPINDLQYSSSRENRANINGWTRDTLDALRANVDYNTNYMKYPSADRMISVHGIIIQPNPTPQVRADATDWGNKIFQADNFALAENFDDSLKSKIDSVIQIAMTQTGCSNLANPVSPQLILTSDTDRVTPREGSNIPPFTGSANSKFTVVNRTNGTLENVRICATSEPTIDPKSFPDENDFELFLKNRCELISVSDSLDSNEERKVDYGFTAAYGQPDGERYFHAIGRSTATDEELALGNNIRFPVSTLKMTISVQRGSFPS